METRSSMHSMVMSRNVVLEALKTNRDKHRQTFLEAQKGYREQVIKELDQMLDDARKGRKIRRAVSLPEPQDHTQDYEAAIRMLEMCVDDEVEVGSQEFSQYVMDNWGWKHAFMVTASNYTPIPE